MKTANRKAADDYLALVQRFPLVAIRSRAECDAAAAFIAPLAVKGEDGLTAGEADYLYAMSDLIAAYEDAHPVPATVAVDPISVLRFLIDEHGMSASDLGRLLGNRSLGTNILTGKRELSKAHIRTLADRFGVKAGLFL
jgi:HTH-type transcriptional regulator/antitoxin HigA